MSSDSIINASVPNSSKDFPKKKRVNRSAKLKQCKLDARREQWLSQVKSSKEVSCGDNRELTGPANETRNGNGKGKGKGKELSRKGVDVMSVNVNMGQIHNPDGDWEESLLANSPTSCVNDTGNNYAGCSGSSTSRSSSASSISFGSGGSCSGSISEEEEGGDDGCLDDWEAVADALVGVETNDKQGYGVVRSLSEEARSVPTHRASDQKVSAVNSVGRGVNNKAWRADDAFRPQSLRNLSKQGTFPAISNPWGRKSSPQVPTSCPICCEDLDLTDSNFLPCPCGFHLCLFCHKRIIEEDSRCPSCRKPYSSEEVDKETGISGDSVTTRLARSRSMFSRA